MNSTQTADPDVNSASASGRLLRSTLIVMAGYLASKAVGVVREPIIARTFGAGEQLDAYYAAFNVPDLLFTLIAGGALASVFIPVFADAMTQRGQAEAWRVASATINLVVLTTILLATLAAFFAPGIVACCLAPGFTPSQQALTAELMRIVLISTVVFALAGVLMGILNAQQHFLSPAFAPALYNIGIIGGALFLTPRFGIHGLAYGVVIGSFMHLASHFPALIRHGMRYRPILMLRDPMIGQMARLMGPRMLALGVIKINTLVATNLASQLGEGSVSALNLAFNVMQLPETIIATAIATAIFPTLAAQAALGQDERLRRTMAGALRAIFLLSVPAMLGLLLLGRPVVQILYQGGRFTPEATNAVVFALQFYAIGLFGHSFLEVGARVFYARKDTTTPLLAAGAAMLLNIALAVTLVRVLMLGGIALANAVAVTFEATILLWIAQRRLTGSMDAKFRSLAVRGVAAGACMAAVIVGIERAGLASPVWALAGGAAATLVYFLVMGLLGAAEVRVWLLRLRHSRKISAEP